VTVIYLKDNRVEETLFIEMSKLKEFMVKPTFP
jgi:hypothetical protein